MSTLSYDKQKLIDSLKIKRAKYVHDFEAEKEFERKRLLVEVQKEIEKHQKDLAQIQKGGEPENYYGRYGSYRSKVDTTRFDRAIARLEACIDTTIKLSDRSDDDVLALIA
jgi:hypothetical protein